MGGRVGNKDHALPHTDCEGARCESPPLCMMRTSRSSSHASPSKSWAALRAGRVPPPEPIRLPAGSATASVFVFGGSERFSSSMRALVACNSLAAVTTTSSLVAGGGGGVSALSSRSAAITRRNGAEVGVTGCGPLARVRCVRAAARERACTEMRAVPALANY